MFLIITPVFLLLVLWSSIDPFEYKKINDAYNCTDIVSKKCVCMRASLFSYSNFVSLKSYQSPKNYTNSLYVTSWHYSVKGNIQLRIILVFV